MFLFYRIEWFIDFSATNKIDNLFLGLFFYIKPELYMDVWKYEIIPRVEQDISLVRFAHS